MFKRISVLFILTLSFLLAVGPYRYPDGSESWYFSTRTEGITISRNGYVGIGKTNPQFPLDVAGTTNAAAFYSNDLEVGVFTDGVLTISSGNLISGEEFSVTTLNTTNLVADTLKNNLNGTDYNLTIDNISANKTISANILNADRIIKLGGVNINLGGTLVVNKSIV